MATPPAFQRIASVVRSTFPTPIAAPFQRSENEEGLPGLLAGLLRYLTLLHLRSYWSFPPRMEDVEARLALLSRPASDGQWLEALRALVAALADHPERQPDPTIHELLAGQGLAGLEEAVKLRNRLIHDQSPEAGPSLRLALHQTLALLLPLRFHRILVPREAFSASPLQGYRCQIFQGSSKPQPMARLQTDLALDLGTAYWIRSEGSRILQLGPLFVPEDEVLYLFSHSATSGGKKGVAFWDPASGKTQEREDRRLEVDSLRRGLQRGTGSTESRQLRLEGDPRVSRGSSRARS